MKKTLSFLISFFFVVILSAQSNRLTFAGNASHPSDSANGKNHSKSNLKWANLYLNLNASLLSAVYINGKLNFDSYSYGTSFHPLVDRTLEVSYWSALNRYCWLGLDYSNSVIQINYNYSREYIYEPGSWDRYYYSLSSTNHINGLSAKIGFGNSWVSNNGRTANPSAMLSLLAYGGVKSNIVSSNIYDNGTMRHNSQSHNLTIAPSPVPSATAVIGNTNFIVGTFFQLTVYKLSFNLGFEGEKMILPLGINNDDKVRRNFATIKAGVGLRIK